MDFSCRLCMKTSIFYTDASEDKLRKMLQDLFTIQIKSTDRSKIVCNKCLSIVTKFYEFYEKVKKVQEKFSSKISESSTNIKEEIFVKVEPLDVIKNFEVVPTIKVESYNLYSGDCSYNANFSNETNVSRDNSSTLSNSLNLKIHSEEGSVTDSHCLSDPLNILECGKDTKVKTSVSVKKIKPKNGSTISNSNDGFPSEIVRNGRLLLKGSRLKNLIEKFYHLECDICTTQIKFSKLYELFQHYETIHKTKGYVSCCSSKLFQQRTICFHMAQHLQPSAFQCPICQKTVSRPDAMQLHMRTHLPETEKPHKCDTCDKGYNSAKQLFDHKLTHVPVEERDSFECEICGKMFSLSSTYASHMKAVHSNATFLCSICGKSFRIKANLTTHMLTHDPPETHKMKCPECGVMCKNKLCLRQHVKTHSLNIVKCSLCKFSTPFEGRLKLHMNVKHSDVKPYCCDICGNRFKLKKFLKNHMAQHTGERKYACSFCPKTFASSGNCYTHRKRMHTEEYNNLIEMKRINSKLI